MNYELLYCFIIYIFKEIYPNPIFTDIHFFQVNSMIMDDIDNDKLQLLIKFLYNLNL